MNRARWSAAFTALALAHLAVARPIRVFVDPSILHGDRLVESLQAISKRGDDASITSVAAIENLESPASLVAEGQLPALVACLQRGNVDGRPAVLTTVMEPRRMLRVHQSITLMQDDVDFVSRLIINEIKQAQKKSSESAKRIVLIAPIRNASVDRLSAEALRFFESRLTNACLSEPGVFIAETALLDRFLPAEKGIPASILAGWRGSGPMLYVFADIGEASARRESDPPAALTITLAREDLPQRPLGVQRHVGKFGPLSEQIAWSNQAIVALLETPSPHTYPTSSPTTMTSPTADSEDPLTLLADRAKSDRDFEREVLYRELILGTSENDRALQRATIDAYVRSLKFERERPIRDLDRQKISSIDRRAVLERNIAATFRKLHLAIAQLPQGSGEFMNWPEFIPLEGGFDYDDALGLVSANDPGVELNPQRREALARAWRELSALSFKRWKEGRADHARLMQYALAGQYWEETTRLTLLADYFAEHCDEPRLAEWAFVYAADGCGLEVFEKNAGDLYLHRLASMDRPVFAKVAKDIRTIAAGELSEKRKRDKEAYEIKPATPTHADQEIASGFAYELTPTELSFWRSLPINHGVVELTNGRTLTIRLDGRDATTFQPGPLLNDKFDTLEFDGRYLWAPVARLSRETDQPSIFVFDTITGKSKWFGKGDGVPSMNAPENALEWSPCAIATLAPGKIVMVGAAQQTWIAKMTIDEAFAVHVEILHTMGKIENREDKGAWRDTSLAFAPERAIALREQGHDEPTLVFITRYQTAYSHPLLLKLNDSSLQAIDGGKYGAVADDLFVIDDTLYSLDDRKRLTRDGPYEISIRRFDLAKLDFVPVGTPIQTQDGGGHAMVKLKDQVCLLGTVSWIAPTPEGPFRRLQAKHSDVRSPLLSPSVVGLDGEALIVRMENDRKHRFRLISSSQPTSQPSSTPSPH